jgi:hypothetical protein
MKTGERNPEHAAREGCVCKLKNRMQQLLEGVQCCFFLHFAEAHRGEDSAGDGLSCRPQQPSRAPAMVPPSCLDASPP